MYTLSYRIRNNTAATDPQRFVDVDSTPEELSQLVDDGYLLKPGIYFTYTTT